MSVLPLGIFIGGRSVDNSVSLRLVQELNKMSNGNGFLSGRYWQLSFIFGVLVFLALSIFLSYRLWQNTAHDVNNNQKIREFQSLSNNVVFFYKQIAAGDVSAIEASAETVERMDGLLNDLLAADSSVKQERQTEYESVVAFWQDIKSHATILGDVAFALNLVNSTANNLSFDAYRAKLFEFQKNHRALLDGDQTQNIQPLLTKSIRKDINDIYRLTQRTDTSENDLLNAVKALLLAREAQTNMVSSIDSLGSVLDEIAAAFENQQGEQILQPIYVLLSAIAFIVCLIGLMITLKYSSQQVSEVEQSETENVQSAILRLLDELADLADGDLTITTTVSEDFTGAIADSVNYTIDQLRQLVSRINNTAVRVSGAAQESQQTALHLAEASDHQAQEIAGASAAINEMAVTIDQVSANAAESALVASKSVSIAHNGAKLVQNTIHGMDTIREQIQDTSKRIKRLGESSQEIGDIVSLINDIADQTNILALNAAIQASMAGDAGRGFAVVADEVQRLAERSAAATKQIETLVKTIQSDTNEAVISMEQTTTEVVGGARLAQDAGVALEEIEGVSANIAELIQNISNAARQQASSAGHISNTMNVIQEITSQTSAGTGATAQAIGDLADMALELRESVAGFKLPEGMDEDFDSAVDIDSQAWASADEEKGMKSPAPTLSSTPALSEPTHKSTTSGSSKDMSRKPAFVELDDGLDSTSDMGFSGKLTEGGNDLASLFDSDEEFDLPPSNKGVSSSEDEEFSLSGADAGAETFELSGTEDFDVFVDDFEPQKSPQQGEASTSKQNQSAGAINELVDDDFDMSDFEFIDEAEEINNVR